MPTDEVEQDRLDMHHEILLLMLKGKLHLAPLKDPQRILDVGTGTGIWAIDAADAYPLAEVVGTDLSPIQPSWVPPNCKFEVDDAEQKWTFADDTFDYIHSRNLSMCVGDWPRYMREVFRCTKPGGFCELGELGGAPTSDDNTLHPGIARCFGLCAEAMEKIGRPFVTGKELKKLLEEAGFVEVVAVDVKQPLGPWPKDERMKKVGAMNMLMGQTGFEAYGMAPLTRILGMSREDALQVFVNGVKGLKNKNYHCYNFL
ncbi:putative TAM domain methyltransferase [Trichophaea hybrida]|nr:putative TAM domain methyltransferase [Trichophaea hybrida]